MTEHTKEPWVVSKAICVKHNNETISIYHYPNKSVCIEVLETGCKCGDEAITEADARRIVTCVNACAGISSEQIENWQITDGTILDVIKLQTKYLNKIEQQRDQLLEALKQMDGWLEIRNLGGLMPDEKKLIAEMEATK